MLQRNVINHRQVAWLVGGVLMTGGMIGLYQSIIRVSRVDAWFFQIIPMIYAILIAYVLLELGHAFPGKNLFEILFLVCGKWVGGFINLILLLYIWMILVIDVKGLSYFVQASLLPQTPLEVILLVFVLLMMSYRTLEVTARVNEIFFPLNVIASFLMLCLLINEYDVQRLDPILSTSLKGIFFGNYMTMGMFGDVLLFGAFLPVFIQPRLFFAAIKHGVMIVGFITSLVMLALLMVMGHIIASRLSYPVLALVQQIHVTDFLDRVDIFLLSIWFPSFAIKVIVAFLALLTGIGSFAGGTQHQPLIPSLGLFLIITSLLSFPQVEDVERFVGYSFTSVVLIIQVPLLLFLWIRGRIERRRAGNLKSDLPPGTRYHQFYGTMEWTSNLSIVGCFLTVLIGKWYYEQSMSVSQYVTTIVIVLLFIALVTSYLQMQTVNRYLHKTGRKKVGTYT